MRITAIDNSSNSYLKQKLPTFQSKSPLNIIKKADTILAGNQADKDQYKKLVDDLLTLIPEKVVKKARFDSSFTKVQTNCTKVLNSTKASIEIKKNAIDSVFLMLPKSQIAESDKVEKYIWGKLIPKVKTTKDKELADHILKHSELNLNESFKNEDARKELHKRLRFLKELGSKEHTNELLNLQTKVNNDFSSKNKTNIEKIETLYNPMTDDVRLLISRILNNSIDDILIKISNNPNF